MDTSMARKLLGDEFRGNDEELEEYIRLWSCFASEQCREIEIESEE